MRKLAALVVLVGCGRLGFDVVLSGDAVGSGDGPGSDGLLGDGPTAVSCGALAPTCGPSGTSPCCESPVVPGGMFYRSYDMAAGTPYTDMGYPATVSTLRLDKYEITVGRFRTFVDAGLGTQANPPASSAGGRTLNGTANQGGWDPAWNASLAINTGTLVNDFKCSATYQTWTDTPGGNENRPMNCVDWYEAMAFCAWDGGFLPTEAEWNHAAAGGTDQRAYPWSSPPGFLGIDNTRASYYDGTNCVGDGMPGCALTDLVPVGTKPAGDGKWGQSDLGGNVWEWTLDWIAQPYPMTSCDDCANLTPATARVIRGGSFTDPNARAANRSSLISPSSRLPYVGLRCARTP